MYSVDVIPYSQLLAQVVGVFPGARMNDGTEAIKVGRGVEPQTQCRLTHVPLFVCLFVWLVVCLFVCLFVTTEHNGRLLQHNVIHICTVSETSEAAIQRKN